MASILVIEDNEAVREEIAACLRFEGHDVREAATGRAGLALVAEQVPDVIVSDLMMPELDGHGTLAALRANPETATVPFVFLTARAEKTEVRRGMEEGADDYLTKPFSLDELRGAVRAALSKRVRAADHTDRQLSALREQMSQNLPHELRTPLACIMGYAEMLADGADAIPPADVATMARQILDAGLRINRIAENALLYMQLELLHRGRGERTSLSTARPAAWDALVRRIASHQALVLGREHDLELRLDAAPVFIEESYLERLTAELIDNAFKFSPAGSRVVVSTTASAAGVELRVTDAGGGIRSEQIGALTERIDFKRFTQTQEGVGLGLPIAQRIASLWGGSLRIDSHFGVGTTVAVILPATPASVGAVAPAGDPGTKP